MSTPSLRLVRRLGLAAAGTLLSVVVACQTPLDASAGPGVARAAPAPAAPALSGAEVWANTCNRCHSYRAPTEYSDAQWSVAVHHMRVQANLTGEEARAVLEYLQGAN